MDMNWRYKWQKLEAGNQGKLLNLEIRKPIQMRVDDHRICVVKLEDGIHGMNNICPHAGAALHSGFINKHGVIACPLHNYKFDIRTGRSADGNDYHCATFKFEEREDGWFLGIKRF